MRIRRKLSVCLLAVFLCGCAGNAEPAEPQESAEPIEGTEPVQESAEPIESSEPVQETAVSEPAGFDWEKLRLMVRFNRFSPALDLCDEYISQCAHPSEDPDYEKVKEIIKSIELISDDPISVTYAGSINHEAYVGHTIENKELITEHYIAYMDEDKVMHRNKSFTGFDDYDLRTNDDGIIKKAHIAYRNYDNELESEEIIEYYDTGVRKKYESVIYGSEFPFVIENSSSERYVITTEYDELGRIINGYRETNANTKGRPQYTYECLSQNPYIIEVGYTGTIGDVPKHRLRIRYADDGSVEKLTDFDFGYGWVSEEDIPLIWDENGRQMPDPEVIFAPKSNTSYNFDNVFIPSLSKALLDAKGRVIHAQLPSRNGIYYPSTIDLKYADSETWESVLRNYKTIYSSYLDALNHDGDFSLLVNTSDDQKKAFEERYKLNESYTYKLQKLEFDRNSYTAEFDEEGRHYSFTVRAVLESEHKETGETGIAEPVIDVKLDNIEGKYLLVSQQSSVNQDSSMQNFVPVTE